MKPEHFDVISTLSYSNHAFMFTDTHTCVSFYASAERCKRKILDADLISSPKPKATLDEEILKRRKRLCKTILKLAQRGKTVFSFSSTLLQSCLRTPSCLPAVRQRCLHCAVLPALKYQQDQFFTVSNLAQLTIKHNETIPYMVM